MQAEKFIEIILIIVFIGSFFSVQNVKAVTLLQENFDDTNFSARSWYDGGTFGITSANCFSGSCAQFTFTQGATSPTEMMAGAARKLFSATDSMYVSYYIKFATGWEGSQQAYHPHMINILSDQDGVWDGPANNHLDTYIEFLSDRGSPYAIRPLIALQDEKNVNTSNGSVPNNLSAITENRSVNYCNTPPSSGAMGTCYADITYYSASTWLDSSHSLSTNAWHHVEAYFEMNSISGAKGQHDGVMQEWIDGTQVINHSDVLYRTNQYPNLKWNQFIIAPYIGDGAPVAETYYMDSLMVGDANPYASTFYNISNFTTLISSWLHVGSGNASDINNDGIINTKDLGIMMSKWN